MLSHTFPRRLFFCLLGAAAAALLPACGWDGHFSVLGYTTKPPYDTSIKTVYVPIFRNETMYRGLEFDLTQAVIRDIESKTPFKVSAEARADTELLGKIIRLTKTLINANQLGEVREAQTIMSVEVVWRDLRPGHIGELLSQQSKGAAQTGPIDPRTAMLRPILIQSYGSFIPEIGGSTSTAYQENVDKAAVQIVSMMEVWPTTPPPPPPGNP